ncbi:MAG: DNA primase [Marinobacterium sp.]|nr:DNA primase [Marinobacterium sp.]
MAGRIPQSFIDDLLARVNIVDVLDGRVNKLKRTGKNYSGLCPFHKEKTPSFTANQDKQFYYCFGCGAGGNALSFLMDYERLDFPEAVEELAKMVGMEVPREERSAAQQQRERQVKDIYSLLEKASTFYCEQLKQHPARQPAVGYLQQRGLSGKIAKQFGIGLAPPGWDNLMQHIGTETEQVKLLERAGMLIHNEERNSYYDRFRERIMFPIRDQRGRVIAFGGRVLGDAKPKYLNSPETDTFHKSRELYGLYEARQYNSKLDKLIIVEGYMDVIGLAQYGITCAVATLGTATTAQHLERLFKMVSEVVFCFDGDAAGRKAASRALETTLPVITDGKEARFLFLPEGEDPDSLVRQEGKEAFEQRLRDAIPLSSFFFQILQKDIDLDHLDGRARFSREALPLIDGMQPGLLQQMMRNQVRDLTGLSEQQIEDIQQFSQPVHLAEPAKPAPAPASDYGRELPPPDWQSPPAPAQGGDDPYSDYDSLDNYHLPQHNHRGPEFDTINSSLSPVRKNTGGNHFGSYESRSMSHGWQRRGKWEKRERSHQPPQPSTQLVHRLNEILLHYPALAQIVPALDQFLILDEPGIDLFYATCRYLKDNPGASLSMMLLDWSDDDNRFHWIDTINAITRTPPLEDAASAEQSLKDGLQKLDQKLTQQRIEVLKGKMASRTATREDKLELNSLLLRLKSG